MPKTNPLRFSAILLACLSASGFADSVTLKNGEKIDGKITSDTATEVVIEEKVSAGVTDSRTIPKADIAKIDKEQPDLAAWQALKNVKPGASSLPAASYDAAIRALTGFATEHPASAHAAEAKQALAAFEEEKKRVEAGEVKLSGKWLSKEEAQKERYQINGQVALNYMREQSTRGDLIGALNSFEILEKTYPGARVYPDAVELARQILTALRTEIERRRGALAIDQKQRDDGIKLAAEPQKSELIAANKREEAAAEAALAAAQKQGLKWPPMIPRSEKSLTAIGTKISPELQRLTAVDVAKMRQSVQLADKAREALAKRDVESAEPAIKQATELWRANELATRLDADLTEARKTAKAAAAATPAPATPEPKVGAGDKSSGNAAQASDADEEETPFLLTPLGAILVVIAIALITAGVTAYRKIKSRANDILE